MLHGQPCAGPPVCEPRPCLRLRLPPLLRRAVVPRAAAGTVDGVRHYKGQWKRTWEVLRDEGGHSYRIEDNDSYKLALGTSVTVSVKQPRK